jgi:hypothetical protein
VFFDIFNTRAIALIGNPSARYSRRISAQSSTDNIPFWSSWLGIKPGHRTRGSKFGCRAGVSFHVPPTRTGSTAVALAAPPSARPFTQDNYIDVPQCQPAKPFE